MATSIFLSYARTDDEPFVRRLYDDLRAAGFDVWFDRESMPSRSLSFHQEIRDEIAVRDRLILVVGPGAIVSDYVTQEWQFAYFAANKCVNPIIRLDGLDVKGHALIPEDLKLLHAEDFRDDAHYAEHLKNLVRQLSEDIAPVGKLVAVPELPPGYRAQPERLRALRDLLLIDLRKPVVVSGATARVGVQGMPGIGKSVLANALAHHPEVQRAFKDNIFWITLGQTPRIEDLQRWLARQLGDEGDFTDTRAGREKLRELLAQRAALLILDDVWERHHADAFNVVGPLGRILLTTRDAGLVTALAAHENHYRVELPTQAEAEALLAAAADVAPDTLPAEAREIIAHCDRLPLALGLCGGMVHGGTAWHHVLEALRDHDLEFLSADYPAEEQHRNVWVAMDASLRVLPEDQRDRFAELAVFGLDVAVPEAAVATLWGHTAGMAPRHTANLLAKFARRSLIEQVQPTEGVAGGWNLHDLLHNFAEGMAIKRLGSTTALHHLLLEAYRIKCPEGWYAGPNDGYFYQRLSGHMIAAAQWDELEALLTDLAFLELKVHLGLAFGLVQDFADVVRELPTDRAQHRIIKLLEAVVRRDIHMIHDHRMEYSQAFFQCAWNNGWWHDSPQVAEHYEQPPEGWNTSNAPWLCSGPKLYQLLERWRLEREIRYPGFVWVRALNPPPFGLRSGLHAVLRGHTGWVYDVAYSPDGTVLASGSSDDSVRLWDSRTGQERAVLCGHDSTVTCVTFSPDGALIASGSRDNTIRVWNSSTGVLRSVLRGHDRNVTHVAFSSDSMRIVSGSDDRTVRVWDIRTGEERAVLRRHDGAVGCVAFSEDGTLIASCGEEDRSVRVWDSDTGQERAFLRGHDSTVDCIAFSPDGTVLASGSWDRSVRVWDVLTGQELAVLHGHDSGVTAVVFSPSGALIASGSNDSTVRVWSSITGKEIACLRGHEYGVKFVAFSPDSTLIASSSGANTVRVWDSSSGLERAVLRGHEDLSSMTFSPDGAMLAGGSWDNTVLVWNLSSYREQAGLRGHEGSINCVACSPDGALIASGSSDSTVRIWDTHSGLEKRILPGHETGIASVSFSPQGTLIASGSNDNTVRVWAVQTGQELTILRGHESTVTGVVFSPNSALLVCTDSLSNVGPRDIGQWSMASPMAPPLLLPSSPPLPLPPPLSLQDDDLRERIDSYAVRVLDSYNGVERALLRGHESTVRCAAFSPDGALIASGSVDATVRVWDAYGGVERVVLRGHDTQVNDVAFSPDGKLVASGSSDQSVRVWDTRIGEVLAILQGHERGVWGVAFSLNGHVVGSCGSNDDTTWFWDLFSQRVAVLQYSSVDMATTMENMQRGEVRPVFESSSRRTVWTDPVTLRMVALIPGNLTRSVSKDIFAGTTGQYLLLVRIEGDSRSQMAYPGVPQWEYLFARYGHPFEQPDPLARARDGEAPLDREADNSVRLNNQAFASRAHGEMTEAEELLRRAIAADEGHVSAQHPTRSHQHNNLSLVLLLDNKLSAAAGSNTEAWQLKRTAEGGHDRTSGRILFVRLALLWLHSKEGELVLGQLHTLFAQGTLPNLGNVAMQWDVEDVLVSLKSRLSLGQHSFLTALVAALNDQKELDKLDQFDFWRNQAPVPLETAWPEN